MDDREKLPGTGRIEAFSDGVIAIIITIMILELNSSTSDITGYAGSMPSVSSTSSIPSPTTTAGPKRPCAP
jgi:uncharacterized membrane protein